MPRAPHRSALLAAKPCAKRWVLASRMSRTWSIPRSSAISTRLTRGTGDESGAPRGEDKGVAGAEIARFLLRSGELLKSRGDPLQRPGR